MALTLTCALALIAQGSPCEAEPQAVQLGQGTLGIDGVPQLVFEGAPLLDYPLALRMESMAPSSAGLLLVGGPSTPLPLPGYGATLFPSLPFLSVAFASDTTGAAVLAELESLSSDFCGAGLVVQALVVDPAAQGSLAFTRGIQLAIGPKKPKAPFDNYSVPLGAGHRELVAADVNLDGTVDLVAACGDGVRVAIGSGKGDFRAGVLIHDVSASAVAVGFMNADAFPDIVATRNLGDELWVFLGDGSGGFDSIATVPTIEDPVSVALGDFDDDGLLDVAVAADGEGLGVHFGQPAAAPGAFMALSPALRLFDVVVSDFDGDGIDDMAACDALTDTLIVRLGSASGVLTAAPDSATGLCPDQIVAGDWNGDGDVDLMSVVCVTGGITRMVGNGDGTFSIVEPSLFPTKAVSRMTLSDLNEDGDLDLVYVDLSTSSSESSRLYTNLGEGDGTFTEVDTVDIDGFPESVVVADLDEDGLSDMVTYLNKGAMVTYGEGDGLLFGPVKYDTTHFLHGVTLGDFDGDGRDDLVLADILGVVIRRGQASGLSDPEPVVFNLNSFEVVAARVDTDTALDLVVTAREADTAVFLRGLGDGTFAEAVLVPTGERPEDVAVGDLNGDSFTDVATLNVDSEDITIAFGDGNGGFVAGPSLPVEDANMGLEIGDLNADGTPDIVAGSFLGGIRVYLGTGGGSFALSGDLAVPSQPSDLALADVDDDGILDVVGSSSSHLTEGAWVLRGLGGATFAPFEEYSSPNRPRRVHVADVNGDRVLDLVLFGGNVSHSESVILRGLGDGGFGPPVAFMPGNDPEALAIGRFGDDLIPDLFVVRDDKTFLVFENRLLD